jgi:PPOX class probable FMN-dependent enzyme
MDDGAGMNMSEDNWVTAIESLEGFYKRPTERVIRKVLDRVDELGRAFIAASPFMLVATGSRQGLDCSPKGDKPGFVRVEEDGRTLLIPDRPGNNRLDGLKNLIEDSRIALIFMVPGANETYRVNGRARISRDPNLRRTFAVDGKEPRTVIVVAVEQAFQHCPKALIRSDLWKAGMAARPDGVPTHGDFAAARTAGIDPVKYNAEYAKRLATELY